MGELGTVDPVDVAKTILNTNSMACPTYGSHSEIVLDNQGIEHEVFFSIAQPVNIEVVADVTFLSENIGGAKENIESALFDHINSLISGEDVIWSRLFSYITPYAKAQVNSLSIGVKGSTLGISNIPITANEFANILESDITITVTG